MAEEAVDLDGVAPLRLSDRNGGAGAGAERTEMGACAGAGGFDEDGIAVARCWRDSCCVELAPESREWSRSDNA